MNIFGLGVICHTVLVIDVLAKLEPL